ncbi:guanine nucleotide-binding protein G(I)/G(S)/G(O) subunit gamma-2 isoform X1 [Callorhinus ursinus]|uniref:guanine nucleotide-binding protein G(I)/G(S)/G(O) subunit gamma-2 isoform X1 n=1 Tax=Callorhinus ursinus TaxID=34884 RepID=UPI003CD026F0
MQGTVCNLLEEKQASVEINWGSEAVGSSFDRCSPLILRVPDLPVSLRLWELKSVSEKPTQHSNGQQQHRQHSTSQEAGRTAEDGSQHR